MNGVLRQLPLAILAAWSLAALLAPWLPLAPDQIGLARILEIPQRLAGV